MSKEFDSDSEFFGEYLHVNDCLKKLGWKDTKHPSAQDLQKKVVPCLYTKNGMAVYVLFGYEESIKEEVL